MLAGGALLSLAAPAFDGPSFDGQYFAGNVAGNASYLLLLDQARRMLGVADPELQGVPGVYDEGSSALVEGAKWAGNIWTQNSYGFGFASTAFLPDPLLTWLQTSFLCACSLTARMRFFPPPSHYIMGPADAPNFSAVYIL